MKIRQVVEIVIDTDLWKDLPVWIQEAEDDGWANDPENAVWYFAQSMADEYSNVGVHIEVIP